MSCHQVERAEERILGATPQSRRILGRAAVSLHLDVPARKQHGVAEIAGLLLVSPALENALPLLMAEPPEVEVELLQKERDAPAFHLLLVRAIAPAHYVASVARLLLQLPAHRGEGRLAWVDLAPGEHPLLLAACGDSGAAQDEHARAGGVLDDRKRHCSWLGRVLHGP